MSSFASDNNAGMHPDVLAAIAEANVGQALSYGDDPWTQRARELFEHHFGSDIEVALTFNGTGANIISLAIGARPFHGIICSSVAHIHVDECGAPERFLGSKLLAVESADGKLRVDDIRRHLHQVGSQHHVQPLMVSITQPNEYGLLYSPAELHDLARFARAHGMYVHMDGARLANAVAALGATLKEVSRDVPVDLLSFGGTKNGTMCGEAVIVFNRDLFSVLNFVRKQAGQLASKMRFISAQFCALLSDDLWLRNALQANSMAAALAERLMGIGVPLTREVQANAVFATLNWTQIQALQRRYPFYVWNQDSGEVRWMTSFQTSLKDVDEFVLAIKEVLQSP